MKRRCVGIIFLAMIEGVLYVLLQQRGSFDFVSKAATLVMLMLHAPHFTRK